MNSNTTPELNQQQQMQQVKAALKNATDVNCEKCENGHFVTAFVVKKLSALVSPTGQEMVMPLQILKCDDCGHVNELFLNNP
jgi:uncharacterized Zn finger protein